MQRKEFISFEDFHKIDIRVGTILEAELFPKAKKPAYKLRIDFGEIGVLSSSAQITQLYDNEMLVGQQVIAVVNFPPKQIADFQSECLILGIVNEDNSEVILIQPQQKAKNGGRIA